MKELTIGEIIMALRYCVAAQNSASGEACVHCEIMKLTGCDKVQACSLLDYLAAVYLDALDADMRKLVTYEAIDCDLCKHYCEHDLREANCFVCATCNSIGCTCARCHNNDKFEWRGPKWENYDGKAEA